MIHELICKQRKILRILFALIAFNWGVVVYAGELAKPTGDVILTVTGNIQNTNAEGKAEFDLAMLEALGKHELQLQTLWTEGEPLFEGVKAIDVMNAVGARGREITAIALNDYIIKIPMSDFEDYPVLLALKMNGEYMTIRDKGPIWIIYPYQDYPELDINLTRQKWAWQLLALDIQ